MKLNLKFNLEDFSQLTIGSFTLSVPIAFSEEAWKAGENLALLI